ncbi:hypothetical protein [Kitasatospora sp. GP82]|uniref:hypothetical protein n=1 Tax=Kitasatospora sp. GP82 TaxID=3035089 RepID=UPI00247CBE89|nr:hypothetical protein [Kitasatospora sp. GP82]
MGRRPDPPATGGSPPTGPASFLAAAALAAIDDAVRTAQNTSPAARPGAGTPDEGPEPALAALVLLRELRTELADWEAGLVDAARAGGATWAELAQPMGVASRQAAENRYLRLRPTDSTEAETGAERVKAVRDRRAAERAVTAWARDHAADLRVLATQVTAAPGLTPGPSRADRAHHRPRRARPGRPDSAPGGDATPRRRPPRPRRPPRRPHPPHRPHPP